MEGCCRYTFVKEDEYVIVVDDVNDNDADEENVD